MEENLPALCPTASSPCPLPQGHSHSSRLVRLIFPWLQCASKDAHNPGHRLLFLPHCFPASVPLRAWFHLPVTPAHNPVKILPVLANINDLIHSFIHSSHKFVSNNNCYQALIWLLRKPHQTSITSSIFPSLNLTFFLSIDGVIVPLPLRALVQG